MGMFGLGGSNYATDGERRLMFPPAGEALGMLHAREAGSPMNARWKQIGPAEGKVVVPGGQEVMLQVRCETTPDFALFKKFGADDFHTLDFLETKIRDKDLANLRHFSALKSLNLSRTEITDAGLEHVGLLLGLIVLTLYGTRISDAGLAHLRGLPHLQTLWINRTGVTDSGLVQLREIKTLRELYVADTAITEDGRNRFRQWLPDCYVRTGKGSVWSY